MSVKLTTKMFGNLNEILSSRLNAISGDIDLVKEAQHILDTSDLQARPGGIYRGSLDRSDNPVFLYRSQIKDLILLELTKCKQ